VRTVNEVLLLLLPIVGVFAIGCSVALLALGKMIDRFPADDESTRERCLASPIESTKIAVLIFWALFIIGIWAVLQETRFGLILGITTLFSVCLFMFTALVFSFAVLSTMRGRRNRIETPVLQVGTPDEIVTISQKGCGQPAVVSRKRHNNYLSGIMMDTILKKD
jgi:MFS family permease